MILLMKATLTTISNKLELNSNGDISNDSLALSDWP